jgi:hypothetical protein
MSPPVDWEAAVALFYNTHGGEWDQALGPSPNHAGCRVPDHILRAYGYSRASQASGIAVPDSAIEPIDRQKPHKAGIVESRHVAATRQRPRATRTRRGDFGEADLGAIGGWLAVHRQWFAHPVFRDEPFTEREAWLWLMAQAAWCPRQRRIGNYVVNLSAGQTAVSIRFLAVAWQWEQTKVVRFLKRLKTATLIRTETATGITTITICRYKELQDGQPPTATPNDPQSATTPQQFRNSTATNYNNSTNQPSNKRCASDEGRGEEKEETNFPKPKTADAIREELFKWQREIYSEWFTWETAEQAILQGFARASRIAPGIGQVRKPLDIRRLDTWQKNGWSADDCVKAVLENLIQGVAHKSPIRSLKYSEPILIEMFANRRP